MCLLQYSTSDVTQARDALERTRNNMELSVSTLLHRSRTSADQQETSASTPSHAHENPADQNDHREATEEASVRTGEGQDLDEEHPEGVHEYSVRLRIPSCICFR